MTGANILALVSSPPWAKLRQAFTLSKYDAPVKTTKLAGVPEARLYNLIGLMITTKAARLWPGGPAAYDVHQFVSLLSIVVALFHGLILTADRFIGFSAVQVFLPFSNPAYRPLWVGIGQVGFYALAILVFSFYVRRRITPRVWRLIHYLSFVAFLFVLIHGITSGTDSAQLWAMVLYWFTGGSVLFLSSYRILSAAIGRVKKLLGRTAYAGMANPT